MYKAIPSCSRIAVILLLLSLVLLVFPASAEQVAGNVSAIETKKLLAIIEEQQRRLDAQQAELTQTKEALQLLRGQVEALQAGVPLAAAPAPANTSPVVETVAATAPVKKQSRTASYEGLHKAVAASRQEWPGSFGLEGTDTRMKISGFAELDIVHDTHDVLTPTAFLTQAIRTSGPGKNDGQTSFSGQATRLSVETRTPLEGSTADHPRQVTTFISADFFNQLTSSTPELRFREAYGEVSDFLSSGGDLLLGQTWSTYTSLYAIPSTLEFWGPNAIFGARNPMVRWTMPVGEGLKLKLAAEAANLRNFEKDNSYQIDSSDPAVSVENRPIWPDGVIALEWQSHAINLTGGLVLRDLRARTDDGRNDAAFGWGATIGGRVTMAGALSQDFLQFQASYGEGIGSLFNDFPPDAAYDIATDELKPIEMVGLLAGYQHWWNPKFYSLGSLGWIRQDNQGFQQGGAYNETGYSSVNLTWVPDSRWLLGAEVVYGSRENKDGQSESNIRTVMTGRFNF